MATSIVMPQLGYDMREGTVVRWLKNEGDDVARGEIIAEIETDKAVVEFSPTTGGVLRRIVALEGAVVPVGQPIAVITDPGEVLPDDMAGPAATTVEEAAPALETVAVEPAAAPPAPADSGEVRASPIARRLAREQGVDLASVTGSGPGGRIVESDVLAAAGAAAAAAAVLAAPSGVLASPLARRLAREQGLDIALITGSGPGGRIVEADIIAAAQDQVTPAAAPAPAVADDVPAPEEPTTERLELSRMRRTIAKVTSDSKREAPHFYVASDIDMTKAMAMRRDVNDQLDADVRVSVNDLIVKASAVAIGRHPKFNSFYREDYLQMNSGINVGIAIALDSGLIVPGIPECGSKSLVEIAAASRDLAARANSGTLRAEEYTGTTYSVSNLGIFDVDSFTAIIFPPHAAILAVGTVKQQPVVRAGEIIVADIMKATLSVDHRVADGAEAAQFLSEIKRLLENPVSLLL